MKLTAWEHFPYPVRKAWRVMRITTLLILVISLHLSAKTTAQKITLNSNDISIEQFFKLLKKQTGYSFLLENGVISKDEKISVNVKDAQLETVLDQILKPIKLSYKIENKTVYILKSEEIHTVEAESLVPPGDIHGRVTDSLGNPLSGASVFVKGTKKGTITDAKGEFTLKGVGDDKSLVISFTGYVSKEFKTNNSSFNITLSRSSNPLDQVQVIAYGTTTQRLSTGDISIVTAKEIEQQPVSNPLAALEGRVPGLIITQNTGAPGGGFTVQIRGQNSIANSNTPFYVIDGVPYEAQTYNALSGVQLLNSTLKGGNPLNYINPYDIESIEVLKDADATAIYGSRAANGAILITTKKGKAGQMQLDININSGIQEPSRDIQLLDTKQYLGMRHEAFNNDGVTPTTANAPDLLFWDTTRYTNWSKVLCYNPAYYNNAQASLSGGNVSTQYLFGVGYNEQSTSFPSLHGDGTDQKVSIHFNMNTQSNDKRFKLAFTGSYVSDKNTVQSEDFSNDRLDLAPDAPPIFNPDGSLNWAPLSSGQSGTWYNPYAILNATYEQNASNMVGNAMLSYTLLPNWELRSSFGYTMTRINETQTFPTTVYDPGRNVTSGYSSFNEINNNSWIIEPQTNYRTHLLGGLLNVLFGGTFHENNSASQQLNANNFVSDALLQDPNAAASISVNNVISQYKYEAAFGRVTYNWKDVYVLNLTARRDGSSRFGPGKQFGNFASIGGAWIFSNEAFLQKNISFLSFGKLRGTYGTTGNDGIGDYQFISLYTPTYTSYGGIHGLYATSLFNPDLAWEVTRKLEGGLELGFLKDRIVIVSNIYQNRSDNQLVTTPVSLVTGFYSIPANLPALVQNSGAEFVLKTVNIKSKYFTWSSSINFSTLHNKLLAFPNLANSQYYSQSLVIGQPITIKILYHLLGVNDTTGLYQFASVKSGPTYQPNNLTDRTALINTMPKFFGGFENSLKFKTISLDFLFQFVKQTGLNLFGSYPYLAGNLANIPASFLNRWQKSGDIAKYQRFSENYTAPWTAYTYATQSDFSYSDASFIRLKNVAVSWQLPDQLRQKLHLQNARIYIQGQNLLTITHYEGIDPESQGSGLPPMRVYTAGIQLIL